jgi:iron complex transport system substrate-binding protein
MSLNSPTPGDSPSPRARRLARPLLALALALLVATAAIVLGVLSGSLNAAPSTSHGITVIDDYGRSVTVPAPATRIVVVIASAMDIVYSLGLRSAVVGVDCGPGNDYTADYTPGQVANWSLAGLACVSALPFSAASIQILDPQLVVAGPGISVSDLNTLQQTDGIPALGLDPSNLSGILHDVTLVGALTGRASAASHLDAALNASLAQDQDLRALTGPAPSVLLTYFDDPTGYYTFGPGSFGESLLEAAGGQSITSNDSQANSGEISGSYVLEANPSIIVAGVGFGISVANYSVGPYWGELSAVQSGHVYGFDVTLLTEPGPAMILGIPELMALLHPGITTGG